jgi:hypothetical protein
MTVKKNDNKNKKKVNSNISYTELGNFQDCIKKSKLFKKFEYECYSGNDDSNNKVIQSDNRLFLIHTFSHSLQFLSVSCEDIQTGLKYATGWGHQGLIEIITNNDQRIFNKCEMIAKKIKKDIIREARKILNKERLNNNDNMPLKISKKGGGTKKRSFQENVGDLKKQGYSEDSARRITGYIQKKQEDKTKKKSKK